MTQESKVPAENTQYDFKKLCVYIYVYTHTHTDTCRNIKKGKGIEHRKFRPAVPPGRVRRGWNRGDTGLSRDW